MLNIWSGGGSGPLVQTPNADGFSIAGGTISRTLTVTGANVTLNQNLQTSDSPTFSALTLTNKLTIPNGGTGLATTPTDGQLLIGKTSTNAYVLANLTGTANQVVVTNGSGTITLSTPQNIDTGATPQFARLGLGAAADATALLNLNGAMLIADASNILAQRNAANAQNLRVYNTFTDTSNFEYLRVGWTANVATLKPVALGSGTVRAITVSGADGFTGNTTGADATYKSGNGIGSGQGGQVNLLGGTGGASGGSTGGAVAVTAGAGGAGGANGGSITITAGQGSGGGNGGSLSIVSGDAGGSNRANGTLAIQTGKSSGNVVGNSITFAVCNLGVSSGTGNTTAVVFTIAPPNTGTTIPTNGLTLTSAITGGTPVLAATGSDSNISFTLSPKGTGGVTVLNGAAAGGATLFTVTGGAYTAVVAEATDVVVSAHTITITGSYAAQRFSKFLKPTITAGSALTVTDAATVYIEDAPLAAGSAVITRTYALWVDAGIVRWDDNIAAPSTSIGVGIVNFYGSSATNFLGDPNIWLRVNINNTNYKIPCYS